MAFMYNNVVFVVFFIVRFFTFYIFFVSIQLNHKAIKTS